LNLDIDDMKRFIYGDDIMIKMMMKMKEKMKEKKFDKIDKIGRLKIDEIDGLIVNLIACSHGRFNLQFQYRGNDVLIY